MDKLDLHRDINCLLLKAPGPVTRGRGGAVRATTTRTTMGEQDKVTRP
jgi:hypothetical protein